MFENLSSEQVIVCYAVILVIVFIALRGIFRKSKILLFVGVMVGLLMFFTGGGLINLNFLPKDTLNKVTEVKKYLVETVGSSDSIKVENGSVYVLVGERWLDVNNISIVGNFTKDNIISYDGEDIYLGHSGVYNTFKVLQDCGLIGGGNN